jgi:wyosine [tRNA(Phe)-imidazoG37] synthetase (radical SAM superfamily)
MSSLSDAYRRHERRWADNSYVYAVVSRRSGGVSVGVNVNPDKACNFDCIYCQVDRTVPPVVRKVDLARLGAELDRVLEAERDGSLYQAPTFAVLPPDRRGVRDIAFSGDGEPTTYPHLRDAFEIAAAARVRFRLEAAKIVLITDAAYLAKPRVREALTVLDRNNGEIWAKLDAGTEDYFQLVDRPNVTLQAVVEGILDAARVRPVVIQSLFFCVDGVPTPDVEVDAYCDRLGGILAAGGRLKALQLYTIARAPALQSASPLAAAELDAIAARVKARVPVPVEVYYGVATG